MEGKLNEWTVDLKERIAAIEARLESLVVLMNERKRTHSQALDLARESLEHRLEGMNEFRHQIEKERATYVTEKELALKFTALRNELKPLHDRHSFTKGRDWALGGIILFISTVIAMIINFLQ
jgi:hypothetical protein